MSVISSLLYIQFQYYSPRAILNYWLDGIFFRMQHFAMNCKQASNNNIPRRTGPHNVISILARESDNGADPKAGDQKAHECHISFSLTHHQL